MGDKDVKSHVMAVPASTDVATGDGANGEPPVPDGRARFVVVVVSLLRLNGWVEARAASRDFDGRWKWHPPLRRR